MFLSIESTKTPKDQRNPTTDPGTRPVPFRAWKGLIPLAAADAGGAEVQRAASPWCLRGKIENRNFLDPQGRKNL